MASIADQAIPYIGNASDWKYHNIENSFGFERINVDYWRGWIYQQWALSIYAALIYLVTIFSLKKYMKDRQAMNLKGLFILWNAGLGIFSIAGFLRTFSPILGKLMEENGFYNSLCIRNTHDVAVAYWAFAFAVSKFVELGDTIFIVLRKRPLQVLQWYHHLVTLIAVWITSPFGEPISMWFMLMNYGVHSAMYPYFALKTAGVYIPKTISNVITTAQLSQMIIGFFLNLITIGYVGMGTGCFRSSISIYIIGIVYASFCMLFGKLFVRSVFRSGKSIKKSE